MYTFSQGQIFILFVITGNCIGVIFDVFRAIRKVFKTSNFVTYIEDIIFIGITGILVINNLFLLNNGEIRFFIILALVIGIIFYSFTISRICQKIFQFFFLFVKKVIFLPFFVKKLIVKKKDFEE